MEDVFTVLDLLDLNLKEHDSLDLHCISGQDGLKRDITIPDLNRPGLALSGFFDSFAHRRIQIFGRGECAYLEKLLEMHEYGNIEKMFTYNMPCSIFTHAIQPPQKFLAIVKSSGCPILQTSLSSSDLSLRLMRVLSNIFSPKISIHGVLVEVYGLGILLLGDSGVGKSETALELIERGHRLVADDLVEISCLNGNSLIGRGVNRIIGHHMEIRGLGIINITQLYGVGSIREQKEIQLVVKLEEWNSSKVYDRLGTDELTTEILEVKLPLIEIPVKPGRNIPIILETAAMNERLKSMGYFSAKEFNQNVMKWIETDAKRSPYYSGDDTY
ncbi:HPr kinase/phosphorylase [Treponema phagedenis]|uniref:HPr(Ser) kinase/phosphatase n=1 Tax=Treponema phagedenis TaxID=162 RepID=UPI0011E830E3|nr:HPr(Ser) kinase/phosphatase [Treponema phagedenis]QEJ95371.1 HPr kinase/phosphorylase [Treponema phagedenis]